MSKVKGGAPRAVRKAPAAAGADVVKLLAGHELREDREREQHDHATRVAGAWVATVRARIDELYRELSAVDTFLQSAEAGALAEVLDREAVFRVFHGIQVADQAVTSLVLDTRSEIPDLIAEFKNGPPVG